MAATEAALVREVLHCCQGIDGGRFVCWEIDASAGPDAGRFACAPGVDISPAQRQLIGKITELGWLLRKIKDLSAAASAQHSVVHEALVAACNREVNNCYRLIAILEAQSQQNAAAGASAAAPAAQLTLRRLVVWLAEPQQRLRVVAGCLEAAVPLRGGQVINALHAASKHGDPMVRRAVGPLLEGACAPFFTRISRWVLDGTLDGPGGDFMVDAQRLGSDHPAAVWRGGYALDPSMVPRFMGKELAEAVLTAGKTVAFLREVCGDSEWAMAMAGGAAARGMDTVGTTAQRLRWLESAVAEVRSSVGTRLMDVVMRRERLGSHLAAVRRYLLLGQGDFVRTLLDLAGPELDRPARDLSVFSLQGHVEAALRSCGAAGADGDLLRRVQVKLARPLEGDVGWDVFGLFYALQGPASAVLGPEAMSAYGRVSRLLWSIKQVDHVVARAWHHLDGVGHSLAALRGLEREYGIDAAAIAGRVPPLLRYLHARRADMAQFVASLQAKIVYEVIEPAWAAVEAGVGAASDLDEVIKAHETGLQSILEGTFLEAGPAAGMSSAAAGPGPVSSASDVHAALRAALRAVLDIQGPIRRLADAVEAAVSEQQSFLRRVRESEASGEWSEEVYHSPPGVSEQLITEVKSGVWRVHSAFDRHVRTFHSLVPQHTLDLRWLQARLEAGGDH
jgi:gamma-tubulin complex component 3